MANIIAKIKGDHVTCELGKPSYSSNVRTPKFECNVQGVVIHETVTLDALQTLLLSLPDYLDEPTAFAALGANKLFWTSNPNDVEFPYTLKKTRSA